MTIVYKKTPAGLKRKSQRVQKKQLQDQMAKLIVEWTKTGILGDLDLSQDQKVAVKSSNNGTTRDKSVINI